ncbi:MAG: DNA repair protein RecO [Paracoccaceae bacterium]
MSWTDRAILLTVAKVAKRTLVLEVLTENYGRVRALASLDGQEAPVLLPGSFLNIHCTGDGMGEPMQAKLLEITGGIIANSEDDIGLLALTAAKDLMVSFLNQEDPIPEIYDAVYSMMQSLVAEDGRWPVYYALLEFEVLVELGHINGMSQCMPAFRHGESIYLSPKTAKVVTREQAGAFLDRVIPVPGILLGQRNANLVEVRQALELTQLVMERFTVPALGLDHMPKARVNLLKAFQRVRQIPKAADVVNVKTLDDAARRKRMLSSAPLLVAGRGPG